MKKNRIEAFSDGVFAVAATLLVFDLKVPNVSSGLVNALLAEWPAYVAFVISFTTIVIIWVNHHVVIDTIDRVDRSFLFINGLLLLTVAAIPFPTALFAQYLQAGHDQQIAAIAYGATMSSMGVAFSSFALYARRFRTAVVPLDRLGFAFGLIMWPIATVIALLNVYLALALYGSVVLFYLVLPIIRERRALELRSRQSEPR